MLPGSKGYFTLDAVPFLGYSTVQYSEITTDKRIVK
jgi:hypothetical protein